MHNPTTSRDMRDIRGFDENLNSARKSIDIETKLYMVIVNRYIKVVVRRIFSILAVIKCNCGTMRQLSQFGRDFLAKI